MLNESRANKITSVIFFSITVICSVLDPFVKIDLNVVLPATNF